MYLGLSIDKRRGTPQNMSYTIHPSLSDSNSGTLTLVQGFDLSKRASPIIDKNISDDVDRGNHASDSAK